MSNWISVKERMPEEKKEEYWQYSEKEKNLVFARNKPISDMVLVFVKCERNDSAYCAIDWTVNGKWENHSGENSKWSVLYWMPLPEAPEEFRKEK